MRSNTFGRIKRLLAISGMAFLFGATPGCDEFASGSAQSFGEQAVKSLNGGAAAELLTAKAAKKKTAKR